MAMYEDLELPGTIVAAVVGVLHLYFMALEAFMWRGRARRVFGTKKAVAELTAPLAANQGYYNGILATGIGYGIAIDNVHVKAMFLAGVAGAGVFGALTVSGRILVVQTVPAVAGFALVVLGAMDNDDAAITFGSLAGFLLVSGIMGYYIGQREANIAAANAGATAGIATTGTSGRGGSFSGAAAPATTGGAGAGAAASGAKGAGQRRSGHTKFEDTD